MNRLNVPTIALAFALIAGCTASPQSTDHRQPAPVALQTESIPLVVFLVRHAEKVDSSDASELSAAGKDRAQKLSGVLADARIEHIHSTDFVRTKQTAAPLAARLGLTVGIYNHEEAPTFVARLKKTGGRHLVVGHSNTTPELVRLLGGKPGAKIETNEYDRLYIVTVDETGRADTVLIRFGKLFEQ